MIPEILGYLAIIAALYILARINDRPRKPTVAELVADARIESALLDGEDDAQMAAAYERQLESETPIFDLTAAHIAAQLSANLDAEWERVSRG